MDLEMKILSSSSFLRKMEMCLERKLLWLSIYDQSADREKTHTTLFFFSHVNKQEKHPVGMPLQAVNMRLSW